MLELDRHVGQRVLLGTRIDKPLLSVLLSGVAPGHGVTLLFERKTGSEAVTLKLRSPYAFHIGRFACSLTLLRMDRGQLRLGFECPKAIKIEREERIQRQQED